MKPPLNHGTQYIVHWEERNYSVNKHTRIAPFLKNFSKRGNAKEKD